MSDRPDISPWEYGKTYETNEGDPCEIIGRDRDGNLVWVVFDGPYVQSWNSNEISESNPLYPKMPERTVDQWALTSDGGLYVHALWTNVDDPDCVPVRWTIGSDGQPIGCVRLGSDGQPLYHLVRMDEWAPGT